MRTQTRVSRRTFLEIAGATALTTTLAGCFGVGGSQSTTSNGAGNITIWDIRTGQELTAVQTATTQFNSSQSKIHATINFFQNDPYKQKLQVAMGAHTAPDIFFGWGGGVLKNYIDANDVYDLTSDLNADTTWKQKYIPAVMSAVTFDGKIYGVPNSGVQPVVFFYNKELFSKYKLNAPQTWSDLLKAVTTLKKNNITPISLAGGSKWPYLMYEEYLVDRFGGPDALNAVLAGQANSWSQDAFIKANTAIQQLVDLGAFGTTFSSVIADTNQDAALLYTGKAGMMLQGSWNFPVVKTNSPDFITSGKLGWFPFPAVDGGKGDIANVAGNPCNFYSISKTAKSPQDCVTYLKTAVLSDAEIKTFITLGDVPAVQGIESQLASAENGDWLQYQYNLVQKAPHYQLSWDQALAPTPAQALLTNLDQLFLKQITPKQFSDNMNKTLTAS
ncbi:MAG TPA: substrate-binding domain-containing protein [Ktedonobacteraceae bacterium]|nr:substrate-binding domain-containing protein [Ktedonobacteraceae bacterium]